MKKIIALIIIISLGTIVAVSSCSYPHAMLKKETSSNGDKVLRIVYDSPKMFSYDTAFKDDKWAVLFTIKDYIQISFPPPGAIIGNRWFYYLGIIDKELNPLLKKPILFESYEDEGRGIAGQRTAVFPTSKGFLVVYLIKNNFFYMEYDINGKKIIDKTKFYTNASTTGLRNKILSINYYKNSIFLFLLEKPENMYTDTWSINLIKQDIYANKTNSLKNIIPNKKGWYHAKDLNVLFSNNSIYISWVNGIKYDKKNNSYKLSALVNFTTIPIQNKQSDSYNTILKTQNYNNTNTRFIKTDKTILLIIKDDKEDIWIKKIENKEDFKNSAVKADENEKKYYLKYFTHNNKFPYKVTIGPK